jgi:2',3'-cyclic-nucleotide 2'-phosphodiesterase (5'-nucleotidase family)
MARFLAPYAKVVDSVNNVAIARAVTDMTNEERCGALPNWTADYAMHFAHRMLDTLSSGKAPKADLAIMNVGGIRQPIYKGGVSEGQILSIYPFSNRMVMVKIKGADLWSIFEEMVRKGGESVSDEVRVIVDKDRRLLNVLIDGEQLQKDRDYHVCTIDYLAWGNDDLVSFKKGEIVWSDTVDMSVRVLAYVRWLTEMGMPIVSDDNSRFISIE